jgi:hypothetical protein
MLVDTQKGGWKDRYRYNMMIFSNFFTTGELVRKSLPQLTSSLIALRNGGMILVLGSDSKTYEPLYATLGSHLKDQKLHKIHKYGFNLHYAWRNKFGKRIRASYKKIMDKLISYEVDQFIEPKTKNKLLNTIVEGEGNISWTAIIFQKEQSFYKRKIN